MTVTPILPVLAGFGHGLSVDRVARSKRTQLATFLPERSSEAVISESPLLRIDLEVADGVLFAT